MGKDNLTRRGIMIRRKPAATRGGLEGPLLPEGSGDEQSPEELRALEVYTARMWLFESLSDIRRDRKRRAFIDYTAKNCEESWGDG